MLGKRDSAGLEATTSVESTASSSMKRERLVIADDDDDDEAVLNVVDDDDDDDDVEVSSELNRTSRRLANTMNVSGGGDQPLDLSVKKDKLTSGCLPTTPQPRPSVIRNGFGGKRTSPSRLLMSTVLAEQPDVTEHFRRSLSGKWPNESQSPSPPSSARSSSTQHVIVTTGAIEIEDHFRKALGPEAYEQWRKLKSQDLAS
uniref:Uncharacterized protein n=1 Tax=Plectus sambesii TaxID=2011161 RepID=A0A914X7H0_9BILA